MITQTRFSGAPDDLLQTTSSPSIAHHGSAPTRRRTDPAFARGDLERQFHIMLHRCWLAFVVSLYAPLTTGILAQTQPPSGFVAWPDDLLTPPFCEARLCDLGGDGLLDLVQQRGSGLAADLAVDTYDAFVTIANPDDPLQPLPVSAFDVVQAGYLALPGDVLAVAGAAGLFLIWFDAAAGSLHRVLIDATTWNDTLLLRVGDVNGDALPDLVGVAADQIAVRIQLGQPGGTFLPVAGFAVTSPIRGLDLLDFSPPHAGLEIALDTDAGMRITTATGAVVAMRSSLVAHDAMAPLRHATDHGVADELFWITGLPNGSQGITVLFDGGGEPVFPIPGQFIATVRCGDLNHDGFADAVLVSASSPEVWILWNQRGVPGATRSFAIAPGTYTRLDLQASTGNDSQPVLGDVDFDGEVDIAVAANDPAGIRLFHGEPTVDQPVLGEYDFLHDVACYSTVGLEPDNWVLHLGFVYPIDPQSGAWFEIVLWDQPERDQLTNPQAQALCYQVPGQPSNGPWPLAMQIPLPAAQHEQGYFPDFPNIFYITIRAVTGSAGSLTQVGPTIIGAFSQTEEHVDLLVPDGSWIETGAEQVATCDDPLEAGGSIVGTSATPVGGFVYARKPIRFPVGTPPHTGGTTCPPSAPPH